MLVSGATKDIAMLELTVLFSRKRERIDGLDKNGQKQGGRGKCFPVELGCRGFMGQSFCRACTVDGIIGEKRRRAIRKITEATEKALKWLWMKGGPKVLHCYKKYRKVTLLISLLIHRRSGERW